MKCYWVKKCFVLEINCEGLWPKRLQIYIFFIICTLFAVFFFSPLILKRSK